MAIECKANIQVHAEAMMLKIKAATAAKKLFAKTWNMNKVVDNVSNKSDLWHLRSELFAFINIWTVFAWKQNQVYILLWSICLWVDEKL